MLETIREHAIEKLDKSESALKVIASMRFFYRAIQTLSFCEKLLQAISGEMQEIVGLVEKDLADIKDAIANFDMALRSFETLHAGVLVGKYCERCGRFREGVDFFSKIIDDFIKHSPQADTIEKEISVGTAYLQFGILQRSGGDHKGAESSFLSSTTAFETASSTLGLALTAYELGGLYFRKGNLDKSEQYLNNATAIIESSDAGALAAKIALGLGTLKWRLGKLDEAKVLLEQSRHAAEASGELLVMAKAAGNLGLLYFSQEDLLSAEKQFLDATHLCAEQDFKTNWGRCTTTLQK